MAVRINHITFDSANAYEQSLFWAQVTGFSEDPDDPNGPDDEENLIISPDGLTRLLFINVPEGKSVKNRVHLDVAPTDGTRDDEVERLLALGATVFADHRLPDGRGWVVMQDPEGNEFCVERSQAERDAAELAAHPS
ncbi:VOC family protein [Leifsonia poae]|uniref:Glyoxalase n=1 Tax=Leifsonia poae TaxID=110933 RepID=A0A9W6HD08_9MICO|nr:VOC family protein [Leifsonia poae]GLJ77868.1 glyoxalase [Leifsonia poae]